MKPTNETIMVEVGSPLLRPGLFLRTHTSKKYAADAANDLLQIARAINTSTQEKS